MTGIERADSIASWMEEVRLSKQSLRLKPSFLIVIPEPSRTRCQESDFWEFFFRNEVYRCRQRYLSVNQNNRTSSSQNRVERDIRDLRFIENYRRNLMYRQNALNRD